MSHEWMRRVTNMSHVTHVNESWHTYEMSDGTHMNESRHTHESVPRTTLCVVKHLQSVSHESRHTFEEISHVPHMNTSHHGWLEL